MEPVTHALTSIAISRAGLNKWTRMATPMLLASGLIADVDWVTRLGGASAFFHGHRTATHSLLGTIVLAAAVAYSFVFMGRKWSQFSINGRAALVICLIGAGVHLLLDLLNGYGVKLMWPFTSKWYAWDLANSVDAWIIFFLAAGLFTPELFRLILQEIGSKPKRQGRQRGAIAGLILVALFIGGRAVAHKRALELLDTHDYAGESPIVAAAFPTPSNPLLWSGVAETDIALVNVNVPLSSTFRTDTAMVHFKPQDSLPLKNAGESAVATEFFGYARFPLANVEPEGDGYQVRLRDMRFATELPGHRGIIAVIDLNAQGLVIGEHMEFDSQRGR